MITFFKKGFSTFDLKILGIVLMFIDHIYQMFVPFGAPGWLDWFGRPVATLFFFISVISFTHTHNKKMYMLRLYFCMVAMSLFTFTLSGVIGYDQVVLINNIFRDLFIGALMMYAIDLMMLGKKDKNYWKVLLGVFLFILPILLSIFVPLILSSPHIASNSLLFNILTSLIPALLLAENSVLVLLIPLFYVARNSRLAQCALIAGCSLIFFFLQTTQWMMVFAIIPIFLYNGKKGKGLKYFFYIFYPTHIAFLYLLSAFLYTL